MSYSDKIKEAKEQNERAYKMAKPMDIENIKAPYRFVALNEEIIAPQCHVKAAWEGQNLHTAPLKKGEKTDSYNCVLYYGLIFDNPVLIGTGEKPEKPYKLGEKYAIPGPTIRGCLRSVMEIAAFAKMTQTDLEKCYLKKRDRRSQKFDSKEVLARTGGGKHLLPQKFDEYTPDFVEMLMGYVHEVEDKDKAEDKNETEDKNKKKSQTDTHDKRHLKGRVSFGFATLNGDTPAQESGKIRTIQSSPKPSFSPFYLANKHSNPPDWSDKSSEFAGYKRYPVRGASLDAVQKTLALTEEQEKLSEDVKSTLVFLCPEKEGKEEGKPLRFSGKIKLHNVTKVELGALVWAMFFGGAEGARHAIGRAKTAGAGQCRFELDLDQEISCNGRNETTRLCDAMAAFVAYMEKECDNQWARSKTIKGLLNTATPTWGKNRRGKGKLDYLARDDHKELRNKRIPDNLHRALGADNPEWLPKPSRPARKGARRNARPAGRGNYGKYKR